MFTVIVCAAASSGQGGVVLFEHDRTNAIYVHDPSSEFVWEFLVGSTVLPSPDGRFLFVRGESGRYVATTAGDRMVEVVGQSHSWSLDGRRLAYHSRGHLHMLDVETGEITLLATPGSYPAWSMTDPNILYYGKNRGPSREEFDLFQLNVATLEAKLLLEKRYPLSPMAASPTSEHLLVSNAGDGGYSVQVLDLRSLTDVGIGTSGYNGSRNPEWSPSGDALAYIASDGLIIREMSTLIETKIVSTTSELRPRQPSWSPDGTRLAFESAIIGVATEVFMVNSDGSELRSLGRGRSPVWLATNPNDPDTRAEERSWGKTKLDAGRTK
ncbi:MAG: hypothetical protein HOH74_06940 [Gemmatimonadetes bacterium]|nr:hypothetical protein [Gemmatimonadota bacterium]